jgi:hypothetical protein
MASRAGKTNLVVRVCTAHRSANLEVRVASDGEDADGWVQEIVERRWKSGGSGAGVPPLGVDMEWKPTFSKGQPQNKVALVQVRPFIALFNLFSVDKASVGREMHMCARKAGILGSDESVALR